MKRDVQYQRSATMENIVFSIMYLGMIIAIEYLHIQEFVLINSSILVFIFQLLILLEEKSKRETGRGIIRNCWWKLTGQADN